MRGKTVVSPQSSDGSGGQPDGLVNFQAAENPAGEPASQSLEDALAELEAYPCPEGVDEELWVELKDALKEALEEQSKSARGSLAPQRQEPGWLARRTQRERNHGRDARATSDSKGWSGGQPKGLASLQVYPPARAARDRRATTPLIARPGDRASVRVVSTPPTGNDNRISDLILTDHYDATYTLTWRYQNLGDYDQNGTVGISDITPLAIHYGEEVPTEDTERNSIQAVVDGSESNIVDIADITPIAMNYGTCCARYSIRSALSNPESIEDTSEIDTMPIALVEGDDRKAFSVELTEEPRTYITVAAMDADETAGELSNPVLIPNHPPVAQITAEPTQGDAPLEVSFDASGSSDIDGPIAKYEWDWEGDGVFDHNSGSVAEVEHTYEIAQAYDPQVRVMDEHNGTDTAEVAVTAGSWRIYTADNHWGYYTDLQVVNGCPAIAYVCDYEMTAEYKLMYVRATDPLGTNWGTPVLVNDDDEYGMPPKGLVSLAVVNGYPAIASSCRGDDNLKYTRANDANGDGWAEPAVLGETGLYDDSSATGLSLVVVNGNPVVAYVNRDPAGVAYMRALDADGSSWGSPVFLAAFHHPYPSMALVNGAPAICYLIEAEFLYVRALDDDGTVWGDPVAADQTGAYIPHNSVTVINGNPTIAYSFYIGEYNDYSLRYVRANDADGETWGTPLTLDSSGEDSVGKYCSLAAINGRPAIAYVIHYGEHYSRLQYVEARDEDGEDWREPVTLYDGENIVMHSSLKEVNGHPAIAYSDTTIRYAIYF